MFHRDDVSYPDFTGDDHPQVDATQASRREMRGQVELHGWQPEALHPLLAAIVRHWGYLQERPTHANARPGGQVVRRQIEIQEQVIAVEFQGLAVGHDASKVGARGSQLIFGPVLCLAAPAIAFEPVLHGEQSAAGQRQFSGVASRDDLIQRAAISGCWG